MNSGFEKLATDVTNFIPRIPEVLLTLAIGYIILVLAVAIFERALIIANVHRALITILRSLLSVILWVVLTAHILRTLGLSQIAVTLSGSLLVIGLAIANGAQTMVADIIAGLFLARDPDFDIGYRVRVGDVEGVIELIDIRKTRIRTDDGTLYILPNAAIDRDRWKVVSRTERDTLRSKVASRIRRVVKPKGGSL